MTYEFFLKLAPKKHQLLSELIEKGLAYHLPSKQSSDFPTMLDIGAGEGSLSPYVLNCFGDYCHKEFNTENSQAILLEPDALMRERLKKALTSYKDRYYLPEYRILDCKFEDMLTSKYIKNHYLFILASHVFYYFDNWQSILAKLLELLEPDGVLCVVLKSKKTNLYRLRNSLPWPQEAEIFLKEPMFSEDFNEILKSFSNLGSVTQEINYTFKLPPQTCCHPLGGMLENLFSFCYGIPTTFFNRDIRGHLDSFVQGNLDENGHLGLEYKEKIFWLKLSN